MESILQDKKMCYLCGAREPLHSHHIFGGTANRKKSERDGMKVWLCVSCHRLVHENGEAILILKRKGQFVWEEHYGDRKKFIKRYGKSYL